MFRTSLSRIVGGGVIVGFFNWALSTSALDYSTTSYLSLWWVFFTHFHVPYWLILVEALQLNSFSMRGLINVEIGEPGSGQGPWWCSWQQREESVSLNQLSVSPKSCLNLRFFIKLNISPAWANTAGMTFLYLRHRQERKKCSCKKYESWKFDQDSNN